MSQRITRQAGYSFVELLTVVAVFAVLTLTSTNLFFSSIVGSSRESAVRELKQNGDYAVVQIENSLRGARRVTACTPNQVSYETMSGVFKTIGLSDAGVLVLDGTSLLSNKVHLAGTGLVISCATDGTSGVTTVNVSFELERGNASVDSQADVHSETFTTAVTLRNRY